MVSVRLFVLVGLIAIASAAIPDYGYLSSLLRQSGGTTATAPAEADPETTMEPMAEAGETHSDGTAHSSDKKKEGGLDHDEVAFMNNTAFMEAFETSIKCNTSSPCKLISTIYTTCACSN